MRSMIFIFIVFCTTLNPIVAGSAPAAKPQAAIQAAIVERNGVTLSYDRGATWLTVISVEYPPPPRDPYHAIALGQKQHAPLIVIEGGMVDPKSTSTTVPGAGQFFRTIVIGLQNRKIVLRNATVSTVTPLNTRATTKIDWSGTPPPQGKHNELLKVCYVFEKIEYTDSGGKALYGDSWSR